MAKKGEMEKQRKGGTKRNLIGYPCIRIPGPIAKGTWRGVHEIQPFLTLYGRVQAEVWVPDHPMHSTFFRLFQATQAQLKNPLRSPDRPGGNQVLYPQCLPPVLSLVVYLNIRFLLLKK